MRQSSANTLTLDVTTSGRSLDSGVHICKERGHSFNQYSLFLFDKKLFNPLQGAATNSIVIQFVEFEKWAYFLLYPKFHRQHFVILKNRKKNWEGKKFHCTESSSVLLGDISMSICSFRHKV